MIMLHWFSGTCLLARVSACAEADAAQSRQAARGQDACHAVTPLCRDRISCLRAQHALMTPSLLTASMSNVQGALDVLWYRVFVLYVRHQA
jgi:hypothetical protein